MKEEPLFFGSGKASFCIKRVWGLNLHVRLGYLSSIGEGNSLLVLDSYKV